VVCRTSWPAYSGLVVALRCPRCSPPRSHRAGRRKHTRLYILEHLADSGGYFERLDVGPATAAGVRVHARFVANAREPAAELQGVVPYGPNA
jgi:hypothetical protein